MNLDMPQGSQEWLNARLGVCTASRFSDILKGARGYKKAREAYLYELVAERLTGISKTFRETAEIAHGKEYEKDARDAYSFITGNEVHETGITILDEDDFVGASPDGLVNDIGGIEVKCFDTKRHINIILNGMPNELMPQVQGNIWVHNVKWWDFVSYDPRIKNNNNIYIQRINRDDEYIKNLSAECLKFTDEVEKVVNKLNK